MADVNANIGVNIDTSEALAQLKSLQRQISQFHTSVAKSSESAALAQRDLQRNLLNNINAIGAFSAEFRTIKTTAESFTDSLERNKFSMREYFRYAGASTKTFGKLFKSEFDTITSVAEDRVKKLQTQYIKLGRDSSGAMKAIAVIPNELDLSSHSTQLQMAAQRQALFNQLVKQGSTNLLNFGKNTQWAGRQLMVGFTIPLTMLGTTAAKTFMEMEAAALKFRKVYGDLFTPKEETQQALADVTALGQMFTKYGVAVSDTVGLAAEAAAAGFQGIDLQRQTAQATRLSVLGQIDNQKALETTISLQNAFKMSSESLASSIDFLNAVENQTVVSLDDITTAIPKVAPVIQQLGGDVKDLAFFMAAMKEGGVNASEGANALKSGLASLINPTEKASAMLASMGINIKQIIESNKGNLKATVIDFAKALDTLDPLTRARAIEQLFGKFQFARLSTLFDNVTNQTGQAARVLNLAGTSIEDLAALSEQELGMTADSAMNKFRKSVEDLKFALVPVGEVFLQTVTPIVEFLGNVLDKFNDLSPGVKKAITVITVAVGAIGPVALMTFGLLANGIANVVKGLMVLRNGYLRLTGQSKVLGEQTQYLNNEQLEASAVAHSLNQSHAKLTQTFNVETTALNQLAGAYSRATAAAQSFAFNNPGMMLPGRRVKKYAQGVRIVPGSGNGDTVPAMLTPGESVIPKDMTKKYGSLINGMIAGNIPGYAEGLSVAGAKHKAKLFSAPSAVQAQTEKMVWETLAKELAAVDQVAEEFNQTLAENKKLTDEQIKNMKRVTAAHKEADTFTTDVGGKEISVKNWRAANLMPDTGANTFLNTVLSTRGVMEDFEKTGLDVAAQKLGISMNDARVELDKLKMGIQPQTRAGAGLLGELGSFVANKPATADNTGRRFQGAATAAIMSERLKGNYYETMSARQYDASKDLKSTQQVLARVKKVRMLVLQESEQAAEQALVALRRRLGISSPSKETMKIGQQMAEGLKVGIEKGTPGVVTASENMSTQAVSGAKRGYRKASSPGGTVGSGGVIIPPGTPPTGGMAGGSMFGPRRPTRIDRARGRITNVGSRFRGLAGGGAGMAVSSALLAGSFLPGKAGDVAGKASAAAFGIQALSAVLKLPIPHIKAFAAGLAITVGIVKAINAVRERERLAIEGLGDAATLTAQKAKTLGDFFGVIPTSTRLERTGPSLVVNQQTRSQLDMLRGSEGFKKDFAKDIKSLSGATTKQAELILKTLAIQLKGKGFAKEQIDIIIKALQEESGQTTLKIDFASLDLTTDVGQEELKKTAQQLGTSFGKQFSEGYTAETKSGMNYATGEIITWTEESVSKNLKKSVSTTSKAIAGLFNGLSGQIENGTINADQFNQSFETIAGTIRNMPEPQAMFLLKNVLTNMPGELAKTAVGIKNVSDQLLIAKAAALGVSTITPAMVKQLQAASTSNDSGAARAASRVRAKIKSDMKAVQDLMDIVTESMKPKGTGTGGGGDGEKTPYQLAIEQLQQQIKQTKESITSFDKLKKAGIETGRAFEIAQDPILAAAIATTKVGTEKWKELLKLINNANNQLNILKADDRTKELTMLKDFAAAVPMLKEMGLKAEDLQAILSDPNLMGRFGKDLKDGKLDSALLKRYIDEIPDFKRVQIELDFKSDEEKFKDSYDKVMEYLDIQRKTIEDKYQDQIKNQENVVKSLEQSIDQLNRKIASMQEVIDDKMREVELTIDRPIEDLQEQINDLQRQIEIEFDRVIEALQDDIANIQRDIELNFDRPIAALQEESSDLANDLAIMDQAAEEINKRYDERINALEQVRKINQQIADQQKQQIGLADALSRGDISAAAQAMQDMRAANAEAAAQSTMDALNASRQAEIAGLRSAGGLTRDQIEKRQFEISQQIYRLEEQREIKQKQIQDIQDKIYAIEQAKAIKMREIRDIEDKIYALQELREQKMREIRDLEDEIYNIKENQLEPMEQLLQDEKDRLDYLIEQRDTELAAIELQQEYYEDMMLALEQAKIAAGEYDEVLAGIEGKAANALASILGLETTVTTTHIIDTIYTYSGGYGAPSPGSGGYSAPDPDAGGGSGSGNFLEFMANGGRVGGIGNTDRVPTMLTPGEFVINRKAASANLPLLSAINSGKAIGMASGGPVGNIKNLSTPNYNMSGRRQRTSDRISKSEVSNKNINTNVDAPVYNYSINVSVNGGNSDPNSIANAVISKIQGTEARQIRKQANYA